MDPGRGCWILSTGSFQVAAGDRWDCYQAIAQHLLATPIPRAVREGDLVGHREEDQLEESYEAEPLVAISQGEMMPLLLTACPSF